VQNGPIGALFHHFSNKQSNIETFVTTFELFGGRRIFFLSQVSPETLDLRKPLKTRLKG
jgi:hypothetical protein